MKRLISIFVFLFISVGFINAQRKLRQTEITENVMVVNQKYVEKQDVSFTLDNLVIKIEPIDPPSLNESLINSDLLDGKYIYTFSRQTREDYFLKKSGKILTYTNKSNLEILIAGLDWLIDNDIIGQVDNLKLIELINADFGQQTDGTNPSNPFNFINNQYLTVFKSTFINKTNVPIQFNINNKIEILSNDNILKPLSQPEIISLLTAANTYNVSKMSNLMRYYFNSDLIIPPNTTTFKYFATLPIDNNSNSFDIVLNEKLTQRSKWEIIKDVKERLEKYTFFELEVYPSGTYSYENIYVIILNSNVNAYIVGSKIYINKDDIDKEISILTYAVYQNKLYYYPLKFVPSQYLDLEKKRRKPLPNELIQIKM
jgi:hypothetical protein